VQDLIVFQDDKYVLLPDSKWDRKDMASMYVLAIVKQRNLRSLRDLRAEHLPLLRHIQQESLDAIQKEYGSAANTVRAYVHYLPSFWHLHIHFNAITCPRMGGSLYAGKAILLDDVIDNITMNGDYYAQCSLTFTVGQTEELYKKLEESGVIKTGLEA
jgi:m7GpppX diphosphatase